MTKRQGKYHYKRYHPDPFIPAILTRTDTHKRKEYYETIKRLVNLLYEHETPLINYNHIKPSFAVSTIPLYYEGEHRDIAYISREGHLVYLLIDVVPNEKVSQYIRDQKWRKGS